MWLLGSIRYIDFNMDNLIMESVFINVKLNGTFNYETLENMEFDKYEKIYQLAKDIKHG